MAACDMCGKETNLVTAIIEGTELNVCGKCAKFGKLIKKPKTQDINIPKNKRVFSRESYSKEKKEPEKEVIQIIVPNYASLIKEKREHLGLKQKQLAKKIAEKESLIHNLEAGRFEPSIKLAKKLERFLKIKLIEEHEETKIKIDKIKSDKFTIGDFIGVEKN